MKQAVIYKEFEDAKPEDSFYFWLEIKEDTWIGVSRPMSFDEAKQFVKDLEEEEAKTRRIHIKTSFNYLKRTSEGKIYIWEVGED